MGTTKTNNNHKSNLTGMLAIAAQVALIVLLLTVATLSFGTRIPLLANAGFSFFAVTSGSMEPTIPTGSLLYSGKYVADDLKEGDIITYFSQDVETNQTTVVTHRIAEVIDEQRTEEYIDPETGEQKEKKVRRHEFVTKGDANNTEDARAVPVGNVIGLYSFHIPQLGFVTSFAQSARGFIALVIVPAGILIVWELASMISNIKAFYAEKSKKEIEKIKAELKKESKESDE